MSSRRALRDGEETGAGCPVAALGLPGVGWGLFPFSSPGGFAHRPSQSPGPCSVTCAHLMARLSVATKTPPLPPHDLTPHHLTPPPPAPAVFSLQDLCCRAIVSCTPVHLIDKLPLPVTIKSHLKSFSMANGMNAVMMHGRSYSLASGAGGGGSKGNSLKRSKSIRPPQSPPQNCSRSNCKIS